MRHYGPVTWDDPTNGRPFNIERRAIGSTNEMDWVDHSACFDAALDAQTNTMVNLSPNLALPLQSGFEYRVVLRHIADNSGNPFVLRSNVFGTPEVAAHATEYIFDVGTLSLGDANDDGIVNSQDDTTILGILAGGGAGPCLFLGDADRDGDVDLDDRNAVFANLGKEFDGCNGECPGGCGGGGGGGGPPGDGEIGSESLTTEPTCDRTMADAIEMLGFDNPGQFAIWFGGLTAEEQDLVITSLDAWINCER